MAAPVTTRPAQAELQQGRGDCNDLSRGPRPLAPAVQVKEFRDMVHSWDKYHPGLMDVVVSVKKHGELPLCVFPDGALGLALIQRQTRQLCSAVAASRWYTSGHHPLLGIALHSLGGPGA